MSDETLRQTPADVARWRKIVEHEKTSRNEMNARATIHQANKATEAAK